MSWLGAVFGALGEKPMQPPEQKFQEQGTTWCNGCDRWTERDALPGTSFGGYDVPTWWFCVNCGWWDADYVAEEAA
jgi:hypothetical protein